MILEIRTYRLHPGTGAEFVRVMREQATPLVEAVGMRVLASGASLAAEDGHEEAYLIRAFDSLEQRERQEDTFYGSAAWREGPREAIMSRIDQYHTVVLDVPEALVAQFALRRDVTSGQ
ncbi:MAG TPA: NIPSNAP family protein [Micromonosporaceae bacterium]|jgi:hypothetical protein